MRFGKSKYWLLACACRYGNGIYEWKAEVNVLYAASRGMLASAKFLVYDSYDFTRTCARRGVSFN